VSKGPERSQALVRQQARQVTYRAVQTCSRRAITHVTIGPDDVNRMVSDAEQAKGTSGRIAKNGFGACAGQVAGRKKAGISLFQAKDFGRVPSALGTAEQQVKPASDELVVESGGLASNGYRRVREPITGVRTVANIGLALLHDRAGPIANAKL
jgi:hypothetical protein